MISDEYRYKILKLIEANQEISQRQIAKALGISLGKANYCLKALMEKGLLKAKNFHNSQNKLAYLYVLTPSGIEEKTSVTARFLKAKIKEYKTLEAEIKQIKKEFQSSQQSLD